MIKHTTMSFWGKNRLIVDIKVWDQESQGFFMIQGIIKLYASNIEKQFILF